MGYLQELNEKQISEALVGAAERQVPVTVTIRQGETWVNLRSRFLAIRGARLIFEPPGGLQGAPPHEFSPAEKIGLSFKYKHHKHVFSTTVIGMDKVALAADVMVPGLALNCPTHMERLQRRAYFRAAVPENQIVRVSFWLGGRDSEPTGTSPDRPVWTAVVTDVSAGGFQTRTTADVAMAIDVGEAVGLRMTFGSSGDKLYADAQFRHADMLPEGDALLGFQFLGLGQTNDGKAALRIISKKVSEYQRLELHARIHGKKMQAAAQGGKSPQPA